MLRPIFRRKFILGRFREMFTAPIFAKRIPLTQWTVRYVYFSLIVVFRGLIISLRAELAGAVDDLNNNFDARTSKRTNCLHRTQSAGTDRPKVDHSIARSLWNAAVRYRIHNSPPCLPIMSQMNPFDVHPSYFFNTHNTKPPSISRSSKWSPFFTFSYQNVFIFFPRVLYPLPNLSSLVSSTECAYLVKIANHEDSQCAVWKWVGRNVSV